VRVDLAEEPPTPQPTNVTILSEAGFLDEKRISNLIAGISHNDHESPNQPGRPLPTRQSRTFCSPGAAALAARMAVTVLVGSCARGRH
jgi:hypothetical protein